MKDAKCNRPELEMTETIRQLPIACQNETAAVEFIEKQRWGDTPGCVHCGSTNVYKMLDAETGGRSRRFLWRCRDCRKQYTVRIGTVYEETRIELRHWCYAFWRASTSKKGVAALEIMRHTGLSYKSALFLLHRIRFAMAPSPKSPIGKFKGEVEVDEVWIGGKPRPGVKRERRTDKQPVLGVVSRGGDIHRRVVADVSGKTLRKAVFDLVHDQAHINTDENAAYIGIGRFYKNGHDTVCHKKGEYSRDGVTTNTIESSFALIKRGMIGIHHSVSKKHLHRYLAHYDFLWNGRKMNDGARTVLAIQSAEGKRLMYRTPSDSIGSKESGKIA
jgi:transposase-like protein